MATVLAKPQPVVRSLPSPGRRYDHVFFAFTAWLMLATVFVGFAPTYYLAGAIRAPLPSTIIHVHGAIFSCWILLLVTQTSLVSAHRVDLHKKLGFAGFALASAMVIVGWWAATDRLARGTSPAGFDPYFFYIIPMTDIVIFGTLIAFAYNARRDPATHKRLIYVATVSLLIAAIARWHWSLVFHNAPMAAIVSYLFLLLLISYDLWSTHKIHRATLWAGGFLIFIQQIRLPIAKTAAWHAFAAWVQSIAR